jgi:hypothetical protein
MTRWDQPDFSELSDEDKARLGQEAKRAAAASALVLQSEIDGDTFVQVIWTPLSLPGYGFHGVVFVHWRTRRVADEDWPSDADEYVFARGSFDDERVQTWCFPSLAMAAALCRTEWNLTVPVPPQN